VKDVCCEAVVASECSICGADPLMYPDKGIELFGFSYTCSTHQFYSESEEHCSNPTLVGGCCLAPEPTLPTDEEDDAPATTPDTTPKSPSSATTVFPPIIGRRGTTTTTTSSLMVMVLSAVAVVGTWMVN